MDLAPLQEISLDQTQIDLLKEEISTLKDQVKQQQKQLQAYEDQIYVMTKGTSKLNVERIRLIIKIYEDACQYGIKQKNELSSARKDFKSLNLRQLKYLKSQLEQNKFNISNRFSDFLDLPRDEYSKYGYLDADIDKWKYISGSDQMWLYEVLSENIFSNYGTYNLNQYIANYKNKSK